MGGRLMFTKGLGLILNLVGVFWLALAGGFLVWKYDRLPAGWPNVPVRVLFFHPTIRLPDSLGARLAAVDGKLKVCAANVATLDGALARQNAAVQALRTAGERMSADASAAVQRARQAEQGRRALASRILAEKAPAGEDELAICRRADGY